MTNDSPNLAAAPAPRVAVIIPLFNGERYITQTLGQVLAQTHANVEVIVVDDGSTDFGPDLVRLSLADSRVALVTKPHLGIARTRNVGLAHISEAAEYVLLLDQDDVIEHDLLAGLVRILERRPDAVGAYALADLIDADGGPLGDGHFKRRMTERTSLDGNRLGTVAPWQDVSLAELFTSNHLYPPSAVLLRRRTVTAVGGCDPAYRVADDWDLMLRLLRRGPIVPWNVVKVGYRRHGDNASGNDALNIKETRAVWSRTFYSPDNSPSDQALLHRTWRAYQHEKAVHKWREALQDLRSRRIQRGILRALVVWRTNGYLLGS